MSPVSPQSLILPLANSVFTMSSTISPLSATTRPDSANLEDLYEDDAYYCRTYVPLSNLPTPPLSAKSDTSPRLRQESFGSDWKFDPTFLGPAIHLTNMIPVAASRLDPSAKLVQSILDSANLPLPTIALAVCILDSLNSRFARSWRRKLLETAPESTPGQGTSRTEGVSANPLISNQLLPDLQYIDTIRPEIIALTSLTIAIKFLDDFETPTSSYAANWDNGNGPLWTCEQINKTEHCIMENLGWRIMSLWKDDLIDEAVEDMERAGHIAMGLNRDKRVSASPSEESLRSEAGDPKAFDGGVWWKENNGTPLATPQSLKAVVVVHQEELLGFWNENERDMPVFVDQDIGFQLS